MEIHLLTAPRRWGKTTWIKSWKPDMVWCPSFRMSRMNYQGKAQSGVFTYTQWAGQPLKCVAIDEPSFLMVSGATQQDEKTLDDLCLTLKVAILRGEDTSYIEAAIDDAKAEVERKDISQFIRRMSAQRVNTLLIAGTIEPHPQDPMRLLIEKLAADDLLKHVNWLNAQEDLEYLLTFPI